MRGRSTGETAKCPLVRRVSDLGHTANTGAHGKTSVRRVSWIWAHDKLFLFLILNQSMEKKIRQNTTLPCARGMAHGKEVLCCVLGVWARELEGELSERE